MQRLMAFLKRIFRFFFPKNFMFEMHQGIEEGKRKAARNNPAFLLGKGVRKIVDPKHKMKFSKVEEIDETKNNAI